jgi:DNA-binding GntR family transcriptional regulator
MDDSLRQQVLQRVRAEIIAGESSPGTMYSVPTLASALGVSSTPVREALLELARAGLLAPVKNRGFRVKERSLQELRDLFNMRELLELHAARLVAEAPKKDLSPLRDLADRIGRAFEADDVQGYLEWDRAYHRSLIDAAGNELLTQTAMGLRDTMRLYGIRSQAGRDRQKESIAEHYEIITLAEAGEADRLEALLRRHIRAWEPIFVEALTQPSSRLPRAVTPGG